MKKLKNFLNKPAFKKETIDILTGLGYGGAAFLIVSFGYITHQANKRTTMKLLIKNNKEEK